MNRDEWKQKLSRSLEGKFEWEEEYFDTDSPPCPDCGDTMIFHGHDENGDYPIGEGFWHCPSCHLRVYEDDL